MHEVAFFSIAPRTILENRVAHVGFGLIALRPCPITRCSTRLSRNSESSRWFVSPDAYRLIGVALSFRLAPNVVLRVAAAGTILKWYSARAKGITIFGLLVSVDVGDLYSFATQFWNSPLASVGLRPLSTSGDRATFHDCLSATDPYLFNPVRRRACSPLSAEKQIGLRVRWVC